MTVWSDHSHKRSDIKDFSLDLSVESHNTWQGKEPIDLLCKPLIHSPIKLSSNIQFNALFSSGQKAMTHVVNLKPFFGSIKGKKFNGKPTSQSVWCRMR